ncbi:MAG: hypothetical protein LQ340_001252 [Diploschistes diacapsis]|nr:MAG: hypothetical protein LQ340_001252 [Diploschistes diacapsis]
MEADLQLIHELQQYIIQDPRVVQPWRVLIQIYSRHDMTAEAVETVRSLLDNNREALDRETYDALTPAVRERLERGERWHNLASASRYHPGIAGGYSISVASASSHFPHIARNYPRSSNYQDPLSLPFPVLSLQRWPQAHVPRHDQFFSSSLGPSRREDSYRQHRNSESDSQHRDPGSDRPHRDSRSGRGHRNSISVKPTSPELEEQARAPIRLPTRVTSETPIHKIVLDIATNPFTSLNIAMVGLATTIAHERSRNSNISDEKLRSALVARTEALARALRPNQSYLAKQALMHITHEQLNPNYTNTETMVSMDPISTIPRERFFVSEDNYAWDMAELVPALKANSASALRNPLSRAPFTEADIEAIVHHPLGKGLAAMRVHQAEMLRGVRKETVNRLGRLARVMLEDEDSMEMSRVAMDDFAAYMATLPREEREALDGLRVPAVDQHTGWGYDASLGEMLGDAKANRVSRITGSFFF